MATCNDWKRPQILTPESQQRLNAERDLDTLIVLDTGERFRVNIFFEKSGPALAARYIPSVIPSLDDLLAPEAAYDFAKLNRGLVLVTGPTGCGKSTLLASIIEEINATRGVHILTLEDPVEFLHAPKLSLIAQRQLGDDFLSFPSGLKHVLRQDPNVILVGEMRDLETIATVITLAETGHLVFATLHTNSAAETVERIVDSFPATQQMQIRLQLATVLQGIIAKLLIPKTDGTRVSAHEVLVNNTAIANLIRESKTNQIQNVLYSSTQNKMHTLDQDLQWLLEEGFISRDIAVAHSRTPSTFAEHPTK
jgi:twitching motility protein PilT